MRVFDYSKLKERTWDNEILAYVAQIHEYKGKQDLYLRQKPVELNRLIEIAKIQSTESSNQIEGIVTTNARLKQLVEDKTTPRNRDEEEILGYRNVLNIVHEAYEAIPVRSNYILQLLILIPNFILDFLCIHPFNDGNGRMSRLLTLLLLYRSGYIVGQYISIEKAIADTKETYYEVLQNADQNWYEGENDPKPFIKYMLGIILSCYREFEARIVLAEKTGKKSKAYDVVKTYSENTLGKFSKHDALVACPSLGSSSVESALKKLVDEGAIIRTGAGRKTMYMKKRE